MRARLSLVMLACACAYLASCTASKFMGKNFETLVAPTERVEHKITHPVRADARLAVLWVGHATALVQLDDKIVLTDPVFTATVGQLSKRTIEPGIDVENVPAVDAVLISHMHFDHLSLGSLELLEKKIKRVYVPEGGLVYIPDFDFDSVEVRRFQTYDDGGLRITAVPARHVGWRYGADRAWMTKSFTAWVVEYHGLTVYFGGDTGYEPSSFRRTAARFPHIDLALLPIGPIHPRELMTHNHMDPAEAILAFMDLGAKELVPVHFDTFFNSLDAPGEVRAELDRARRAHAIDQDRVHVLEIGAQRVVVAR